MSINRDDIAFEGRKARRLFWEKCASRQPVTYHYKGYDDEPDYETLEDPDDIARWADYMLAEWDKRWIESQREEDLVAISETVFLNEKGAEHE